jgi:hypothetical protein
MEEFQISAKQTRLDSKLKHLYGVCPDQEVFCVVTCYACGMVLKPQALNEHIERKHKGNNLLMDETPMTVEAPKEPAKVEPPKAKRQKLDHNRNIASFPLGYPPELVITKAVQLQKSQSFYQIPQPVQHAPDLQYSHSFTLPNPIKRRIAHQPKQEPLKIKMKLRRVEHGQWSIV